MGDLGDQSVRELAIVTQLGSCGGNLAPEGIVLSMGPWVPAHKSSPLRCFSWCPSAEEGIPSSGFLQNSVPQLNPIYYRWQCPACGWDHGLGEASLKEGHLLPVRAGTVPGPGHIVWSVIGEQVGKWIHLAVWPFSSSLHLCVSEEGGLAPRTWEIFYLFTSLLVYYKRI